MANERLDRFTKLLKEIFELDKSDLDFGIYRVMNLRKTEIETFLTERLLQMVQETLAPFAQGSKEKSYSQMAQIEESVVAMGMTIGTLPDTAPMKQKYVQLQKQLAEGADLAALETDVYSALYAFFNRYYEDGDFISKRRYKEGVYAIPYEGEEVKLYWANQDQYYIKTGENFKDYTFAFDDITAHFRLVDATTEQDNNKESKDSKRTFMLFMEDEENYPGIKTFEYDADAGEIVIRFVYDVPQDKKKKYAEENYAAITKWLLSLRRAELNPLIAPVPTGKGKETTTLLEKHLKGYVAKNTFDYFIHKDLRGFLTRELDFYIKSEVMHLEDLDTGSEARVETYLAKVKAIKRVGKIIIDFLAQIEDFQKKLWLKKKFVVETNWCITLDKIDESFWVEIIANKTQINEWISLYAIDEAENWSNPPTVKFLQDNQNLVVDTKHFSDTFKYSLLESIPNLDEQTDGLMINGDNFHALHLLQSRYAGSVNGIYIDPPYNTDGMEIIYKNGYKDSSWLSLLSSRILLGNQLLANDAIECVMIDDAEYANLFSMLRQQMPAYGIRPVIIEYNHRGRVKSNFAYTHEYGVWAIPRGRDLITREHEISDDIRRNLRRTGTDSTRQSNPGMFYGIQVNRHTLEIISVTDPLESTEPIPVNKNPDIEVVWPIDDAGIERRWYYGKDRIMNDAAEGTVWAKKISGKIQIHYHQDGKPKHRKTLWYGPLMDSSTYGTELLNNIFGLGQHNFSFPKSINAVTDSLSSMTYSPEALFLDYFGGSGTTGHAVLNLNRSDEGSRRYILVEMGDYFNSVTKPRIEKIVYAPDWKNGKPQQRNKGVSQLIKYMRLESYEDALSNIELSDNGGQLAALLGEDYLIHYMVDLESRGSLLNVEAFSNPFSYTMKITEKNECKQRGIDLCETFNYLIGLTVTNQSAISYFLSKPAEAPAYEGAVDLVSDISGQHAFRQIEGTLPDGRRTLVIWRTVTEDIIASNAALDAYFTSYRKNAQNRSYDVIFVNGDSNLENLRGSNEGWKVQMTEIEFKKRMFEEV
ncbi:MAG: DNA methyltransferase [Angelakisella sp.]|nr:DNA methyltransferase [Angelakisella sp.]